MRRVLLLVPTATYRATDFLAAASALGAEVVVASEHRQAMAAALGDRALTVPLDRPEAAADAIVELAGRSPIDAVVAVDDQGAVTAALASARLGLAHNPPEAVAATRDKEAMRVALAGAGVAQPAFRVLHPGDDAGALAGEVGLPCVVKPVSLSGSRGVIRADDAEGAVVAAARARAIQAEAGEGPEAPLLVEAYLPGDEVAVEGLLRGGELEVLALFDKPDPLVGPYFEETIYVTPSRLGAPVQGEVAALTERAARAIGLVEGPVHAEVRLDGSDLRVLELAARSIGGLCSRALRFGAGVSLEEVILRHAVGLPLDDLGREGAASGVMMIPVPVAGSLQEVRGLDAARAVAGIVGVEITTPRGRTLRPLPEGHRYLGFIFARGEEPEEVEGALREAHARLEIMTG